MSFLRFNKKKKQASSIYSSQHTKLGLKKYLKRSKFPFLILVSLIVTGGLYLGVKTVDNKLRAYFNPEELVSELGGTQNTKEINFTFIAKDHKSLSSSEKEYITKSITSADGKKDLLKQARSIKIKLSLKQIHILQTASDSVTVSTEKLVPILSIKVGKNNPFYITEDATVYPSKSQIELPEVKDIEFNSSEIEEDGYLFLTEEEYLLISNVVKLYKELQSRNIDIDSIKYIKHRGLAFNIKNTQIDVIVGNNLFDEKLKKLTNVLKNKKDSSTTTLVELDYNNKAFITEKSL